MKTSSETQIEKMNAQIKEAKELLKLYRNGEDYFKHKMKKFKSVLSREQIENLNEEKLQSRLDDLSKKINELKKSKTMVTIYNDGMKSSISVEEVQLFMLAAFRVNSQAKFGLIKNADRLDRVSVFVVEDDRLSKLVMEQFAEDFDHQIQFQSEEGWTQNLLNVQLKKSFTDLKQIETSVTVKSIEINEQVKVENQITTNQRTISPTLRTQQVNEDQVVRPTNHRHFNQAQLYNPANSRLKFTSQQAESNRTSVKRFFETNEPITRTDLLLSIRQLIKEHYPLPIENSVITKATKQVYKPVNELSPMFAMDCEMCKTEQDELDVTRISLIDEAMNVLMDEYVLPKEKIIDYLTQYSGIKPEHLANVTTTLEDIHQRLNELLPEDAILVGHSLNCDLQSLKLSHPYVIDTSCIYNFSLYINNKPSLKQLSNYYLKNLIQNDESGHCSIEDARAAMKLVQLKLSKDITFGDNRLSRLLNYTNRPKLTLAEFLKLKDQEDVKIVYNYLELESFTRFVSVTSKHMNKIIDKIAWASIQANSICIVILNGTCLIKVV